VKNWHNWVPGKRYGFTDIVAEYNNNEGISKCCRENIHVKIVNEVIVQGNQQQFYYNILKLNNYKYRYDLLHTCIWPMTEIFFYMYRYL
jgi:hypothetical protein